VDRFRPADAQYSPGEQSAQFVRLVLLRKGEYVPAGQGYLFAMVVPLGQ
jgi:hypothetical protein